MVSLFSFVDASLESMKYIILPHNLLLASVLFLLLAIAHRVQLFGDVCKRTGRLQLANITLSLRDKIGSTIFHSHIYMHVVVFP